MNILELVPGITGIIEKIIPDPNKQQELKLELAKIEAQETTARLGVLGNMLGHKSMFVAGGIPALIWLAVIYILANYILFPLLGGFGMQIEPISLPDNYWSLLNIVVVGLFGKKVIDGNEWRFGDKLISPSKAQTDAAAAKGDTIPVGNKFNYNDIEEVDRRLKELAKKYEIKE
ncbi:MAG: 3TM-type holin [Synergistaceae bacterium]